jgi:hypothetical protein
VNRLPAQGERYYALLEMLDGDNQPAEYKHRYGGNRHVQKHFFLRAGLTFFISFDLLVKAIEHNDL